MTVLAIGFDLFFKPKLMSAADAAGTKVVFAKPEEVAARAEGAERVIADASAPGVLEALAALRNARPDLPVLACYPHVEEDVADALRAMNVDAVTRGQLDKRMGDAVAGRF